MRCCITAPICQRAVLGSLQGSAHPLQICPCPAAGLQIGPGGRSGETRTGGTMLGIPGPPSTHDMPRTTRRIGGAAWRTILAPTGQRSEARNETRLVHRETGRGWSAWCLDDIRHDPLRQRSHISLPSAVSCAGPRKDGHRLVRVARGRHVDASSIARKAGREFLSRRKRGKGREEGDMESGRSRLWAAAAMVERHVQVSQ
jgi:hypothetical protein